MTALPSTTESAHQPPAPDEGPLPLEARDIHKTWDKRRGPVLDGLDLTLPPGSLTWIAGRNGAGKTTLLRILSGLIASEGDGWVTSFGLDPFKDRKRYQRIVALLPAGSAGLYARLPVDQQIDTWARIAMIPRAQRKAVVEDAIERFALRDLVRQRSDRLSMGQRQRVRLAVTFLSEPRVVLLDEPTNSLDDEGEAILVTAVQSVLDRGGAALWVSPTGEKVGIPVHQSFLLEHGRLTTR